MLPASGVLHTRRPGPQTPTLAGTALAKERVIRQAVDLECMSPVEGDEKLRALRALSEGGGGGVLTELPTRAHGDGHRLNLKDQWRNLAGPYPTAKDARCAIHDRSVHHGNNGGEWAANSHETGGGCKGQYHCNGHVGCRVLLRVRDSGTAGYFLQATVDQQHTLHPKTHRRSNSPLSIEVENYIADGCSNGKKPKRVREDLQEALLKADGTKNEAGGMDGERSALHVLPCGGFYPLCPTMYGLIMPSCHSLPPSQSPKATVLPHPTVWQPHRACVTLSHHRRLSSHRPPVLLSSYHPPVLLPSTCPLTTL
jgi:hypothetical protein